MLNFIIIGGITTPPAITDGSKKPMSNRVKHQSGQGFCQYDTLFPAARLNSQRVRKKIYEKKFVTWYAEEIKKQMDAGVSAESIDVNLKLTSLKALHANWLIELYNVLTTADGRETVLNGWKKSGVTAVLKKEEILPPKDPFSSG